MVLFSLHSTCGRTNTFFIAVCGQAALQPRITLQMPSGNQLEVAAAAAVADPMWKLNKLTCLGYQAKSVQRILIAITFDFYERLFYFVICYKVCG